MDHLLTAMVANDAHVKIRAKTNFCDKIDTSLKDVKTAYWKYFNINSNLTEVVLQDFAPSGVFSEVWFGPDLDLIPQPREHSNQHANQHPKSGIQAVGYQGGFILSK